MIGRIAARNVMRNKRRTLLAAMLIGCGLGTLILHDGLIIGMEDAMIRTATETYLGHAQIHHKGFRATRDVDLSIADWSALERSIRFSPPVVAYAPRVVAMGMLSSPANVIGVMVNGIDPGRESQVSKLKIAVVKGRYLNTDDQNDNGILMGTRLAKLLEVDIGDRVVVTAAQANGGDLAQELFRVAGLIEFKSRQMDQGMAFVSINRLQKLLGMKNKIHEVALRFSEPKASDSEHGQALLRELSQNDDEALGWREIMPQLAAMTDMSRFATLISGMILFVVVSLGVINSIFMSIYERIFEFGVLRAVGTTPCQMARMVFTESIALALLGILIGLLLGAGVSGYFSVYGMDFTGIEYAGVSLKEPMKTVLSIKQFTLFPSVVVLLTLVCAIYPAIHVARILPAQALRKSL